MAAAEQSRLLGEAWERAAGSDKLRTRLIACKLNGEIETFVLGPHAPPLTTEDLELIHRLWLQAVGPIGLRLHHRDVVRAALEAFAREMNGPAREQALKDIRRQVEGTDRKE
jgi:hypothetical protein